jgi:hypothetical protein
VDAKGKPEGALQGPLAGGGFEYHRAVVAKWAD